MRAGCIVSSALRTLSLRRRFCDGSSAVLLWSQLRIRKSIYSMRCVEVAWVQSTVMTAAIKGDPGQPRKDQE